MQWQGLRNLILYILLSHLSGPISLRDVNGNVLCTISTTSLLPISVVSQ
jgi:hypothetical protein